MEVPEYAGQSRPMHIRSALAWVLGTTSAASFGQTITISLYDYSGLDETSISRITEDAGLVLGHAAVGVKWVHCRGALASAGPAGRCEQELGDREIVVRLVASEPKHAPRRAVGLASATVEQQGGHYATVHVPAVRQLAQELGVSLDLLLAYSVVHEAVHCFLGPAHSNVGVMRATWNKKDSEEMTRLSLALTRQEARKLAAVLELPPASPGR